MVKNDDWQQLRSNSNSRASIAGSDARHAYIREWKLRNEVFHETLPTTRRPLFHYFPPKAAGGENAEAESGDGAHHDLRGGCFRHGCPVKRGRYHHPAALALQSQRHIPGTSKRKRAHIA